jgi:cystathionine beta-lyase
VIPLWVPDMDLRSAPAIVEALQQCVAHAVYGTTTHPRHWGAAVRAMLRAEYGWDVPEE